MLKIKQDHARFKQIVRGKIKQNLRKYITKGEMLGKKGKDVITIPLPQIEIPHFKFGSKQTGGVGQGDGEVGTPLGPGGEQGPGTGPGAGDQPGEHALEVDLTLDELAQILGEELGLPRIQPRGRKRIVVPREKFTSIRRTGPEGLRVFKRTYKEALKRQLAAGLYDPERPIIIPIREDKRFRSWKTHHVPESNAVIIYMMDVSGSMGDEQKEIVRIESFWIDTWLRSQYKGIESRYLIHDAAAREVDRDTFFHTRESGGTMISSAYKLCWKLVEEEYPRDQWNIYPFHFSDGDNWSADDTNFCVQLLKEKIVPNVNLFCYGQVESPYGSGQFIKDLTEHFVGDETLLTSEIKDKEAIYDSIKIFLSKGK
jgi:hypothetical protein